VTTVEAPESHLRENPFEIAREQLHRVAEIFAIDQRLYPPQVVRLPLSWGWAAAIGILALLILTVITINPPI